MTQEQMSSKMWTPANVVTVVRILLIPVFVVVLLSPWPAWMPESAFWASLQPWLATIVFAGISATDALDGYLARSRNEVTDFGKFIDPLADKILVCAALLALIELQEIPSWIALIIIAREFIVSGLRMLAASKGVVIAASWYGKTKTVLQIIAIIMFIPMYTDSFTQLLGGLHGAYVMLAWVVMIAAVVMTILSMLDYFKKSKELFQ